MKKRIYSILLCLCLVLMLCPATAFAEGETKVSHIAVTIDVPVLGEKPDFDPAFTVTPEGSSVKLDECTWWKISEDDYTGTDEDYWDEMSDGKVFEEGYYYAVDLYFIPDGNCSLDENMTATMNGKPHDDTYGSVYYYNNAEHRSEAYVSGVFGPLLPTLTIPFTTKVELGGNTAPKETVFTLELVDYMGNKLNLDSLEVTASVTTNGAGSYDGAMTITGSSESLEQLYSIMFDRTVFVQQVNSGEDGWTYDDTIWGLYRFPIALLADDEDGTAEEAVKIYPTIFEETGDGTVYYDLDLNANPVAKMSFTNIYTKNITNNEITTGPQTGDNSNLTLWLALLAVAAAGLIGTGMYSKRRRSFQAK